MVFVSRLSMGSTLKKLLGPLVMRYCSPFFFLSRFYNGLANQISMGHISMVGVSHIDIHKRVKELTCLSVVGRYLVGDIVGISVWN